MLPDPPAWLDELDFGTTSAPWLAMGVTRVADDGWLLPDDRRDTELALRAQLLDERHDEVFAALPGTEDAGAEVLALVEEWLAARGLGHPEVPRSGRHPLEVAGRSVQEDLCLLVPRRGAHHLDAACLCFPSHWRLADKLGRTAAAIHGPVPGYDRELRDRVDTFLDRLRPEVPVRRRNWTVHDRPDLFAPVPLPPPAPREHAPGPVGGRWLRSERQTLRRLPGTGAVLFTIRVQQVPFATLATRPDLAASLAARLRAQPPALTAMNGLAHDLDAVLRWLDEAVAHPGDGVGGRGRYTDPSG